MKFRTEYQIPSNNAFTYSHWSRKHREKEHALEEVWYSLREYNLQDVVHHNRKANVTITRVYASPKRAYDLDNLYGGAKSLLDAIKQCNLINDDSEEWLDLQCAQRKGDRNFTEIEITHS